MRQLAHAALPPRRSHAPLLGLALVMAIASCLIAWSVAWYLRADVAARPQPLADTEAEPASNQIATVFAAAQADWSRLFAEDRRPTYQPVTMSFFVGATPSPCADAAGVTGPFYCEQTRTAAFDLRFFADIVRQLHAPDDLGPALLVGQIAGQAVQQALGVTAAVEARRRTASPAAVAAMDLALALQADCLTGVWAHAALASLGPVPPGHYGRAIQATRRLAEARGRIGWSDPMPHNLFGLGEPSEREKAFAAGYAVGTIEGCVALDPAAAG